MRERLETNHAVDDLRERKFQAGRLVTSYMVASGIISADILATRKVCWPAKCMSSDWN